MRKKIIALLLAVLTILSVSGAVSAQDSIEEQAAVIKMLNIMNGDPDGNFRLEDYVTRAEFSKVAIAASSYRNSVAAGMNISPFEDVPYTHWATPYIKLAVTNKIVSGYPDSTFRPDQTVTYEEALTIVLKLLGYTNEDFGSSWPYGQVGLAKNLSLTDGIDRQIGDPMTRGNVVTLFYNLLDTKMKGNTAKYITVLDCEIVESVILIATTEEDPAVNDGKIATSNGTYKISSDFDRSYVGRRGNLIVKNGDEIVAFMPSEQIVNTYEVTSSVGSDLVLNGTILNIDSGLTVYNKSQKSTYSALVNTAKSGYEFRTYASKNGIIEYALLINKNNSGSVDVTNLEKYVVYSTLDDMVIAYHNGELSQISIPDSTTAYLDNQQSTFGGLKSKVEMGTAIYVKRDTKNNIEYVNIEQGGNMEGPITVNGGNWHSGLVSSLDGVTVMRDGQKVSLGDLKLNDIAYYSSDLNMILAYSTKKTGIYEKALPNKDMPTSVIISGVTYSLEGVAAFNALSSTGNYAYGDTITVMLGKDGKIADVMKPQQDENVTLYGYLTGTGKKDFTNAEGDSYSSYYITVVQADGETYEYTANKDYSKSRNSIVKVTFEDGVAQLTVMKPQSSLSGKVNASKKRLGNETLSDDVQILDIGSLDSYDATKYSSVYPQRIDGLTLDSSDIAYYTKDANGEIDNLFLMDVTGDIYDYGIVTSVKKSEDGRSASYTYDIGGTTQTMSGGTIYTAVSSGHPAKFILDNGQLKSMVSLLAVNETISGVTSTTLETSGETYTLAPDVVVYKKTGTSNYLVMPLSDIVGSKDYTFRAYYDKKSQNGGRIRIIVATEK